MQVSPPEHKPYPNAAPRQNRRQNETESPPREHVVDRVELSSQQAAGSSAVQADVTIDIKVDAGNKTISAGEARIGKLTMQGIGYTINPDFTLTPFISCLPGDDPASALPLFEKQIFGKNSADPYNAILKHLFAGLPDIQERFFPVRG